MNTTPSSSTVSAARISARRIRPRRVRGLAVILALVAVGAAVVLSLALASTRDQGALTSDSIVRVAAARTASAGSLDIACALVEQHGLSGFDTPNATGAVLFPPVSIGNRSYSAEVVDLATSKPIDGDTIAVRILAKAQSDGITQTSTAIGRLIQPDTVVRADVDLSEFGLLTTTPQPSSLRFTENSTLGVWAASPLAQLREPVMIGSSTLNTDAVAIGTAARLRGYTVLKQGEFPETDDDFNQALANKEYPLPHEIHVPEAPRPGRSNFAYDYNLGTADIGQLSILLNPPPLPDPGLPSEFSTALGNMNLNGDLDLTERGSLPDASGANEFLISNNTDRSGETWRQLDISGDLDMGPGDVIKIDAPTLLIVRGDLNMLESKILVANDTPFTLVVFGSVKIVGSRIMPTEIGTTLADPALNYNGGASNLMIYATMDGRPSLSDIRPSNRRFEVSDSTIQAQIYAPSRALSFSTTSLYGRALGMDIEFSANSNFFYDPALNEGRGWSNPTSGLWEDPETPRQEVTRIAQLNDASISTGTAYDGSTGALTPSGSVVAIDPPAGRIVVPAHAAFVGGITRDYGEIIESILANVTDPDEVRDGSPPNKIMLGAIVRDFNEERSPSGHPDFERIMRNDKTFMQLVQPSLGSNGRPQYSGNPVVKTVVLKDGSDEICWALATGVDSVDAFIEPPVITTGGDNGDAGGTNNGHGGMNGNGMGGGNGGSNIPPVKDAQTFASWFEDKPGTNISMPVAIEFERKGSFREFSVNEANNPVRGALYGDLPPLGDESDSKAKAALSNGHFTMEFALGFKRDTSGPDGNQTFVVETTGDALVYINGALVLEMVSKEGNPMQRQKVPMDRLPIANNAYGEIRIFYANRTKDEPAFNFTGNFPMWQDTEWLKDATFTQPAAARETLGRVAERAVEAKQTGALAEVETIYADRSGNWSRRIEPVAPAAPPATIQ